VRPTPRMWSRAAVAITVERTRIRPSVPDTASDFDYVVIGAGSSGCVVVNRLSADPGMRVLLLEAGVAADGDPAITTPGQWTSLIGSSYDWGYATEKEEGLAQRAIAFPRGKALGGTSAINAMTHMRGHRRCFDGWREAGNPGWGYDDLLPLFKRSERYDGDPSRHRGSDGPLAVSRAREPHEGHEAFLSAAAEQGFRADHRHDFNTAEPEAVAGFYQKNILNGRRHSAADAFLTPIRARANLTVRSSAHVTRLIIKGRRVTGVEYVCNGQLGAVSAHREVVLCAGAVESPRILMSSGIGPADQLRAHGIRVVADVAGVGRNLQDHLKLSIRWCGRTTLPASTVTAGLVTSSSGGSLPDLLFYVGRGVDQPDPFVTITVALVRPQSRGTIELRSSDPLASPIIRANYLQSQADVAVLVAGVRLARQIGLSPAYDRLRGEETDPGDRTTTAGDLERFVRAMADTIYHPAGTCRMGRSSDSEAVVDASLRVRGVDGLRVADASIMPDVVDAPTHAAAVMIGEKCAALIQKDTGARGGMT